MNAPSYTQRCDLAGSLVGKKIRKATVAKDGQTITFATDKGEVVWEVDADCCSHTWIENADIEKGLVTKVAEVPGVGGPQTDSDHEYIQYYGIEIVTMKGHGLIDFRNSSNGYYGGSMRVRSCPEWEETDDEDEEDEDEEDE